MRYIISILSIILPFLCLSQSKIQGVVTDNKGEPIFAANLYLKESPENGVVTDFNGGFSIEITDKRDTLLVSFVGFETEKIPIKNIDTGKSLIIVLRGKRFSLEEVLITSKDPISKKFAVTKMTMLKDVYLNPASQGDPLKAITVLPASTSIDEMANPSLRGSSTDRSRVILNGVPIYKPVRASTITNQGFFSLFNPEVISKQYVYASNPPLTYGNTSAGLVEIQTIKDLQSNQLQLSASLASMGLFLSRNIKQDISFIQVYGNYQFSDAFVEIQKSKLPDIKKFNTIDVGINFHTKIGKKAEFNSYNYFIDESFAGYNQSFTYKGDVSTLNQRIFTVNILKYHLKRGVLSINSGADRAGQSFSFGNIKSVQHTSHIYTSIDYKWHPNDKTKMQFGISHDFHQNRYSDSIPVYYYALSPNSPSYFLKTSIHNHIIDAYLYSNRDINDDFTLSSGVRSNLPVESQKYYFSYQLGLKYRLGNRQSFLLSSGKYHNYSMPNYYSKSYHLLSAYQIALDYDYSLENTLLKLAGYFKHETGKQPISTFFESEKINTFGVELYVEHYFYKYFKVALSNSFIDQKMTIYGKKYRGARDFNYFLKTSIQYNNPKLFSLALTYTSRPGISYNEIVNSVFDSQTNFYKPIFSNDLYSSQFKNYNRIDISLSKYMRFGESALIAFVSINNFFDFKNERTALYNTDYSTKYFDFYQLRTVYFGMVFSV